MNTELFPKMMKIRWRWDGDEADYITYENPSTGTISVLNPLAAAIFSKCDGKNNVKDIANQIFDEFSAPDEETVNNDVVNFVQYLEKIGAVTLLSG